MQPRYWCK